MLRTHCLASYVLDAAGAEGMPKMLPERLIDQTPFSIANSLSAAWINHCIAQNPGVACANRRPMRTGCMTETEADCRVAQAIEHLRAFAASIQSAETIDQMSSLTGEDLNIIVGVFDDVIDKNYGIRKDRSNGQI